jgi:ubiquinone/menaquinone biosynthesis C-methylase UbiE
MALPEPTLSTREARVEAIFESGAAFWRDVYGQPGAQAEVYRDRLAAAREWIDGLACEPGSRALDLGCGAGFLAVAMARRGFRVAAMDSSEAMVELTRRTVAAAQTPDIAVAHGDARDLDFPDASFDLVVAIALLPWVHRIEPVIDEIARVLKPGGYTILTADNRARLNAILDPRYHPALAPLREKLKAFLVRVGLRRCSSYPPSTFHRRRFVDATLARAGLVKIRGRTIGFGPFSVLGHVVVPEPHGTNLHHRLQRLADRGVPVLRGTGAHYLVQAQKAP